MNALSRRDLIIAGTACAVTPLSATRLRAADLKVDLSQERVGQPPTAFAPIEHDPEKLQTFRTRSCNETSD